MSAIEGGRSGSSTTAGRSTSGVSSNRSGNSRPSTSRSGPRRSTHDEGFAVSHSERARSPLSLNAFLDMKTDEALARFYNCAVLHHDDLAETESRFLVGVEDPPGRVTRVVVVERERVELLTGSLLRRGAQLGRRVRCG